MKRLHPALFALALFAAAATPAAGATDDAAPARGTPAPAAARRGAAPFTTAPSGWYAELRGGFATQELGDADANIAFVEGVGVNGLGAPGDLRRFGEAAAFAVEFGRTRGGWNAGLAVEHQRQRVKSFAAGTETGSIEMVSLLGVIDVKLAGAVRPAKLFGFELGASAGLSFAHYSEAFDLRIYSDPDLDYSLSGAYHATAPVVGAHLGWRRPFYGDTWLVARGAWAWRDFGEFEGSYEERDGLGSRTQDSDLLRLDGNGKAKLDASGFQFTAGLSHTFGGRR